MKPPYTLNSYMLKLCTEITHLLGQVEGLHVEKPEPKLRKSNRVRTIQASLAIEGNTLALDEVTALFDGKRVLGPSREILEVQNAIKAYEQIIDYNPNSIKSLQKAHGILTKGLIEDSGKWRAKNVGVFQGERVAHAAPQAKRVPDLMEKLFLFLKREKQTHPLILSAIFHYELEFIHPFSDGNGRIGRLWQTTLLTRFHPIFEFTPVESVIRDRQTSYYEALGLADKSGDVSPFIEFSLNTIFEALQEIAGAIRPKPMTAIDRLELAREKFQKNSFSRKEYLVHFKSISTATASRDLAFGVTGKMILKTGEQALATYKFK